jgi:hypothetical protein
MGGYDVFCAICGAALKQTIWEEQDEEMYDPSVLNNDTSWMEDVRIISENPDATSMNK